MMQIFHLQTDPELGAMWKEDWLGNQAPDIFNHWHSFLKNLLKKKKKKTSREEDGVDTSFPVSPASTITNPDFTYKQI